MYGCGTQNVNTASSNVSEPTSQAESQDSSATSSEVSEQPMNDNITLTDTTNETERTKLVYPTVSQMDGCLCRRESKSIDSNKQSNWDRNNTVIRPI